MEQYSRVFPGVGGVADIPGCAQVLQVLPGVGDLLGVAGVLSSPVFSVSLCLRLTGPSGHLTDGPGNYKYKTKCTWLIEGQ